MKHSKCSQQSMVEWWSAGNPVYFLIPMLGTQAPATTHLMQVKRSFCLYIDKMYIILCLIPRTTVTSLSASKNTCCKTHPLCVNPGVPFWTCEKTHKLRARWQWSSSGIRTDVTVVLEVRQSIETVSIIHLHIRYYDKRYRLCQLHFHWYIFEKEMVL